MITKELIELLHQGASIQRWNDHLRPHKGFTELDKQAHKLFYLYALKKCEPDNSLDEQLLIEGCIFEYLHRVLLTDIKPPVFHKLMAEKGEQINRWVLEELRSACQPLKGNFYEKFRTYLLDPDYGKREKSLISAAHYLATAWEFSIVYPLSSSLYDIQTVKAEIDAEIAQYFSLPGVQRYYADVNIKNFLNLVGQLRFQQRWARCYRIPETSVLGHMLIVAVLSYLFTLEIDGCSKRLCNNFYGGLFHDLPEVLTRDIVSPVKRSVEGLDDIIKDIENDALEQKIFPLLPKSWHNKIHYYIQEEFKSKIFKDGTVQYCSSELINETYNNEKFNPLDGELIRGADHLSAFIEAYLSIEYGISSQALVSGQQNLYPLYKDRTLAGLDLEPYFKMFSKL